MRDTHLRGQLPGHARGAPTVAARFAFWLCAALALLAPVAAAQDAGGPATAVPGTAAAPAPVGAPGTSIGRVVIASGLVEAEGAGGTRVLNKGDPVFEGDILRTDPGGRTQITFRDGARLAVRPATRLAIEAYHDADPGRTEQVAFRLERGGFRTATGRLGRVNRSAYRFSTPQAVIGIRGTEWGAQMVEDEDGADPSLEIGVVDGGITVTNDGGSIDLGEGAAFAFATVEDFGTPPAGATEPPAGLTEVLQVQLEAGSDGDADAPGEPGPEATGDDAGSESEDAAEGDESEQATAEDVGTTEETASADGSSSGDGELLDGGAGGAESAEIEFGGTGSAAADDGDIVFEYGDRCF